jgi:hypothetical protein
MRTHRGGDEGHPAAAPHFADDRGENRDDLVDPAAAGRDRNIHAGSDPFARARFVECLRDRSVDIADARCIQALADEIGVDHRGTFFAGRPVSLCTLKCTAPRYSR